MYHYKAQQSEVMKGCNKCHGNQRSRNELVGNMSSRRSNKRSRFNLPLPLPSSLIIYCIFALTTTVPILVQAFLPSITTFSLRSIASKSSQPPLQHIQLELQIPLTSLQMAKRVNNSSAGGKKKKKKKNNNAQNSKKKGKKNKRNTNPNASHENDSANNKPKSNQHLPPWQVMNESDVQTNIQSEKQRRDKIRSGEIESSVTSSTDKIGDVSASSSLLKVTDRQLLSWKRFSPDKDVVGMKFTGAYLGRQLPPQMGCPEVAFLGRSNVGKSSLLNKLVKRVSDGSGGNSNKNDNDKSNDSARVGKTPGATASVNIYSIQGKTKSNSGQNSRLLMGFADLPGFGYAKLSKEVKESVEMAAERYLGKRRELALGILLVDVRRVPSDDDRAVLAALYDMGVPLLVVATKVDKMRSKNSLSSALEDVRIGLGLPEGQPFYVSSVTGVGVKQLWSIIMDACEDKVEDLREELEGKREGDYEERDPDDTIMLDDEGNWIEEEEEPNAEGLEWVRNFAYYDDSKERTNEPYTPSESSLAKMKENEDNQAAANEAMKLKKLRKTVREMERRGEI